MDKYSKEIKFHLPGLFRFFKVYETIINLYETRRKVFKDNLTIGSIYGSPGYHIWNGGRLMQVSNQRNELEYIKDFMASHNIPSRFTFTNCLIEEKHLFDTMCNDTTELFHSELNEIICNSPILEKYLRENYPKYSFISSTTKRLTELDDINAEYSNDYKLIVLDYKFNNNFEILKDLKDTSKLEILCNAVCFPNCPKRLEHYRLISQAQIENNNSLMPVCEATGFTFDKAKKMPHFVSIENINKYIDYGVTNFKLEGRTNHPLDLVEILLYYLIKEDFKDEVRAILHKIVW